LFKALNYWLKVPADKLVVLQEVFQNYRVGVIL